MAKTSGPLFSLDARGKFGGAAVYSVWKGISYVRQLVTPANPMTTNQGDNRIKVAAVGKFSKIVDIVGTLATFLRTITPNGQSYISYFAQQSLLHLADSITDYNDATYSTQKGYFDTHAASAGLEDAVVSYATDDTIPAGAILWNAYQSAYVLGVSSASTTARTATNTTVGNFVTAVTS